jgi:hypothetical protein
VICLRAGRLLYAEVVPVVEGIEVDDDEITSRTGAFDGPASASPTAKGPTPGAGVGAAFMIGRCGE